MLETKFTPFPIADLDAETTSETGRFEGYASLFDTPDENGDRVAPGAFSRSLAQDQGARVPSVKLLWQHDPRAPIGVWRSITEDARGLRVVGELVLGARRGRDAAALLAAGALDGLSIGYRVRSAEKTPVGRRLLEVELWEISLVTFPMLREARVSPIPAEPVGFGGAEADVKRGPGPLTASTPHRNLRRALEHARATLR